MSSAWVNFVGEASGSVMACFPSSSNRQTLALCLRCVANWATEDFGSSSSEVW